MHYRPPGRSAHPIVPQQLETTLEGCRWNRPHRPGAQRPPFSIRAAAGADERASLSFRFNV